MADNSIYRLYTEAGKDGYPPEWHSIDGGPGIKHLVRESAGHRCIRCKHPYRCGEHPMELVNGKYESWSPCDQQCDHDGPKRIKSIPNFDQHSPGLVTGYKSTVETKARVLTVHHLDEAKLNCRWWNLAALCQRCHLTIQGRVKLSRPYMFEHSEWFRPYVAGFYAWHFGGEDLTREETMERLDELLGLARAGGGQWLK